MFRLFFYSYILFPFPILQLGISSHENATPVKLIHNSAGHLNGPARTVGATLIGYLGESDRLTISNFFICLQICIHFPHRKAGV